MLFVAVVVFGGFCACVCVFFCCCFFVLFFVCLFCFLDVIVVLTFHVFCSIIYHEFPTPASISSDRWGKELLHNDRGSFHIVISPTVAPVLNCWHSKLSGTVQRTLTRAKRKQVHSPVWTRAHRYHYQKRHKQRGGGGEEGGTHREDFSERREFPCSKLDEQAWTRNWIRYFNVTPIPLSLSLLLSLTHTHDISPHPKRVYPA